MKRLLTLTSFIVATCTALAQTPFYTFTKTTEAYKELDQSKPLSPDTCWGEVNYKLSLGNFDFAMYGEKLDTLLELKSDYLNIKHRSKPGLEYRLQGFLHGGYRLVDRNFDPDFPEEVKDAKSRISYAIEGAAGERILKIQFKNVKYVASNASDSINFQYWLYEKGKRIELHYGPTYIGTPTIYSVIKGIYVVLDVYDMSKGLFPEASYLSGDTDMPKYSSIYNKSSLKVEPLIQHPKNGTVYRFVAANSVGFEQLETLQCKLYPNPATELLHIVADKEIEKLQIFDMTGRSINTDTESVSSTEQVLNVSNLKAGYYLINVKTTTGAGKYKFLKM